MISPEEAHGSDRCYRKDSALRGNLPGYLFDIRAGYASLIGNGRNAKAISSDHGTVLEKIGAEVVYPERDMALRLGKRLIANNNFLDFISLSNEVEIQQIPVTDRIAGISVERLDIRRKYGLNIIAIESNGNTETEISPEYRIRRDDILVVIGKMDNIWKFEHEI